jgi:hypothetical protein
MMNKKTKQLCGGKGQKRYGNYRNDKGFKAITVSPPDTRPLSAEEEQSCGLSGQQCFWRPVLCFPAETLCMHYAKWVRSQASQPPGWAVLVMTHEEFVEKFGESAIRSMLSSLKESGMPTIHWSQVVACGGKLS